MWAPWYIRRFVSLESENWVELFVCLVRCVDTSTVGFIERINDENRESLRTQKSSPLTACSRNASTCFIQNGNSTYARTIFSQRFSSQRFAARTKSRRHGNWRKSYESLNSFSVSRSAPTLSDGIVRLTLSTIGFITSRLVGFLALLFALETSSKHK